MGGARNRVKGISEKKKQREFFQRQRQNAAQASVIKCSATAPALSHDLISFYLSERNLLKQTSKSKPTQIIKEDLDKRSSNIFNIDLSETPLERNAKRKDRNLPQGWKIKIPTEARNSKDKSSELYEKFEEFERENGHILEELPKMNEMVNEDKNYAASSITDYMNSERCGSPTSGIHATYLKEMENAKDNFSLPSYLKQTPDINEAFKKYVSLEKKRQQRNGFNNHQKPHSEFLFNKDWEKILQKENMNQQNHFGYKTCKSTNKPKYFDNMDAVLSRHAVGENLLISSMNSQPTFSELSQYTFSSMPTKVSRHSAHSQKNDISAETSGNSDSKSYRTTIRELEKMIEEANLQDDLHDSPRFEHINSEHFSGMDAYQSPLNSASSSSSSGMSIPFFFQKKRKHDEENSINNCNFTYKKIKKYITDSKQFDFEQSVVNHKKKIKISNTTLLTPKRAIKTDEKRSFQYSCDAKSFKTRSSGKGNCNKSLLPSSFLSYFPTPAIVKRKKEAETEHTFEFPVKKPSADFSDACEREVNDSMRFCDKIYDTKSENSERFLANTDLKHTVYFPNNGPSNGGMIENFKKVACYADAATSPFQISKYPETVSKCNSPINIKKCEGNFFSKKEVSPGTPQITAYENNRSPENGDVNCETGSRKLSTAEIDENITEDGNITPDISKKIIFWSFQNSNNKNNDNKQNVKTDKCNARFNAVESDEDPPTIPNTPEKFYKGYKKTGDSRLNLNTYSSEEDGDLSSTKPTTPLRNLCVKTKHTNIVQDCVLKLISPSSPPKIIKNRADTVSLIQLHSKSEDKNSTTDIVLKNAEDLLETSNESKHISEKSIPIEEVKTFHNDLEANPFILNISTYMNMGNADTLISPENTDILNERSLNSIENQNKETINPLLRADDISTTYSPNDHLTPPSNLMASEVNLTKEDKTKSVQIEGSVIPPNQETVDLVGLNPHPYNELEMKKSDKLIIASSEEVSSSSSDPEIDVTSNKNTVDVGIEAIVTMNDAWTQKD
ncbi:hypothetical protein HNY73_022169 [Argiope bruennichi]|uniref:Uncharacterized protein n=1 Tax=Argiope bruennichi TaxID=94029 RepID=A0A8T0DZT4_ARGBR|nr:hypothetical protein HNY73_022169 [Argiope bruennichi]